ncbi:MAG: phage tail tape measure protein [Desulfomicrobium sp.]|nr:phage tail tape measure protein [Desulfomicrobium sp.]
MSTATTQIIISGKDNLSSVVADAGRRMGTELQAMQRNVLSLQNAFVGLAGGVALNQIRQTFTEYDTALRDMGKVTDESMDAIAAKIREVPAELGTSAELIRGYYQVISAGVTDPVKAMETLVSSSEAAKSAHVQQAEVIKGITKVMAGYAGDVKSAAEAADLLFTIEKQGQTSFAELIPVIGDVSAISKQLSVDQKEMGAALAAVTQTAGSTSQAATQYRMMLVNLMKPTKDMQAALDAMGVSSGKAAIEQFGLSGTLQRLQLYAERSGKSVAKLFESSESLLAVAALSRGEFAQYNANLQAMEGRAGSAAKAFAEWQKSSQAVDDLLRNTLTNTLVKIGEKVMPTVNAGVREFADFVAAHDDEIAGTFGRLAEYGETIGAAVVPALKDVGSILQTGVLPPLAAILETADATMRLVPGDYQSSVGAGIIGYVLLGPKGAVIAASIAAIDASMNRLTQTVWELMGGTGNYAAAHDQLREKGKQAFYEILTGQLGATKGMHTYRASVQNVTRMAVTGAKEQAAAVADTTGVVIAGAEAQSKAAATALARVRGEIAKLTMSTADYAKYQLSEEYAKLAKELGAANPELQRWLSLKERELRLNELAKLEPYQVSELERMNRGDMFFGKADADKRGQAMLEDLNRKNDELLTEFAERHRAIVLGETEFKLQQLDEQAKAYKRAGADEIAIAQWVAQEKLAISRAWNDGAQRALLAYVDEGTNAAMAVESVMTTAFQGMEDVIVNFVETGKFEFTDLVTHINSEIGRLAFKDMASQMYSFLGNAMGGGKSSSGDSSNWLGSMLNLGLSAVGSYFGGGSSVAAGSAGGGFNYAGEMSSFFSRNAKGGVYSSPSLSAYSNGVYDTPQVFAFAKGGIFAEAGPEAIMPLARGADGSLGVKARGADDEMKGILRELVDATRAQKVQKNVFAFDRRTVANELSGSEGRQMTLTHVRSERAAIRSILGIS